MKTICINIVEIKRILVLLKMNANALTRSNTEERAPLWLELVQRQVSGVRCGVVQIVIHDSRVVQIERTEKVRLDKEASEN